MRDDDDIKSDVLEEIDWDPRINTSDIGVTVSAGAVTLLGTVGSYSEQLAAENAARRVKGVKAIAQEVKIAIPGTDLVTDEVVATRIAHMFEWNSSVPDDTIQAKVKDGYVTLTGEVDWNYTRELAADLVSEIQGVRSVVNQIKVRPRIAKNDVTSAINRALHRHANLEASQIKISIDGHKVILSGEVRAWQERKLVEEAVWAAPGVTEVIDNIRVV